MTRTRFREGWGGSPIPGRAGIRDGRLAMTAHRPLKPHAFVVPVVREIPAPPLAAGDTRF